MADRPASNLWTMRAGFLMLAAVIIVLHLIPLDTVPRRWAPPDFLLIFTFAWLLRRPEFVPVFCVAIVMLMADFLFQRPPGLFALLTVIASEYLRKRTTVPGETSFVAEWAAVAVAVVGITIAYRLMMIVLLVPPPPLGLSLIQMVLTVITYPAAVVITQLAMGVRRPAPNESGAAGGRA